MNTSSLKVLIIGKVWPEPASSAAGSRMMELIEVFQSEDWQVTFASAASESQFAVDLKSCGVECASVSINSSSFDHFAGELNPDIVVFDRFMTEEQFGWRVAEQCPGALRILDTEDLHFLREGRYQACKKGKEFETSDLFNDKAKREIASILRCDLSLIISEFETNLLEETFRIDKQLLLYLPFLLEQISENSVNNWKSFDNREDFISIGNFLHEPNWNAVLYLKEEIWPLIRAELPKAELHIYGAYSSQKVQQLHNESEGFLIKGRAESATDVVGASRMLLAPLRFGAGLKGKLVEAMQCGTPSVTTTIGAEGMNGNLPWPGFISDDPREFADRAIQLYKNEELWKNKQEKGLEVIHRRFDKETHSVRLIERIKEVRENLEAHRHHNFMGSMLQHHTLASTKFMGKWIEAKNRITD
ncbi:glycosyltransferase [Gracilimonas sediminicola]|uniref:Glycosyltransferase family 4 protein n=1 Tax=Gracilimonas sediminicola TaxID=2952158 RepID=A0A9X2L6M9_9BACT|nr:glycosyltransferase [Gracilimonas sediminicola]MCP9292533.1 glycosyltransferase family 4 protein [Gracilimonas sediminicola]